MEIIRENFPPSLSEEYAKNSKTYIFTVADVNRQVKKIEVIRTIVVESSFSSQATHYGMSGYQERLTASFVIKEGKKKRTLAFVLKTNSEIPIFEGANFSNNDPVEIVVIKKGEGVEKDKLVVRDLFN